MNDDPMKICDSNYQMVSGTFWLQQHLIKIDLTVIDRKERDDDRQ